MNTQDMRYFPPVCWVSGEHFANDDSGNTTQICEHCGKSFFWNGEDMIQKREAKRQQNARKLFDEQIIREQQQAQREQMEQAEKDIGEIFK